MLATIRRYVTFIMLVALAIPMLAACGGAEPKQPAEATKAPAAEATKAPAAETTEAPTTETTKAPTTETTEAPTTETTKAPTTEATKAPTTEATKAPTTEAITKEVSLPKVVPSEVKGDIIVAGSSTVYPLTERMAELFQDDGYAGLITIDSIGSGAGFERFCVAAETDISNASRAIKDEEIASCEKNGRTPLEFRVGTDALAVVVSAENDFLTELTMEELAKVFSPEATTWADINPDWPAEKIQRFAPGTDSGTFDFFVEAVFDKDETPILETDAQFSEDDNVLVQGVLGSPYAIGFFGYAYYNENKDDLKAIAIDGVEPTEKTAEDNTYPLSRPLFIYSAASVMKEKPQVASFINYYLTYVNDQILDVGYFPASAEALNKSRATLLEAMGNVTKKEATK